MKKLESLLLSISLIINAYYTHKLYKFAKSSSEYYEYIQLREDCFEHKLGMDYNDIFLAAHGKTREELKGQYAKILPIRRVYDIQDEACEKYAKYMCWVIDPKDKANLAHCSKESKEIDK